MTSPYNVASKLIQELLGAFLKHENAVFDGEQEKESISRVTRQAFVMPNGDPRDRFF